MHSHRHERHVQECRNRLEREREMGVAGVSIPRLGIRPWTAPADVIHDEQPQLWVQMAFPHPSWPLTFSVRG